MYDDSKAKIFLLRTSYTHYIMTVSDKMITVSHYIVANTHAKLSHRYSINIVFTAHTSKVPAIVLSSCS